MLKESYSTKNSSKEQAALVSHPVTNTLDKACQRWFDKQVFLFIKDTDFEEKRGA